MGEVNHDLILLNCWPSAFGARVKIALEEKGLSYEYKEEDLPNKSSLLLGMNPIYKKVPVLIHNGKPLCESLIIVQYIDEVWNDHKAQLLPSDPFAKSRAIFWGDYVDKKVDGARRKIIWGASKQEVEEGKIELIKIFKVLEGELEDKPYFGGDAFGYVDIALIGFHMWFHVCEVFGDFNIEIKCPKLIAWGKRCLERESVQKSLADPNTMHDWVVQYRKKLGLES